MASCCASVEKKKHGSVYMNRRAGPGEAYEPTCHEQFANTASHGIAIIPSLIAMRWMINASHCELQQWITFVYGTFTAILFISSASYHGCELLFRPRFKKLRHLLHLMDRAGIYFYIAGSYTPWLALRDCGPVGANLKWLIWVLAVLGILYQYNFHEKYKTLETVLYFIIGVPPLVTMCSMVQPDSSGLSLMFTAGMVYVLGVIFFKMDGVIPFAHAIWHCHVLVGALLQFVAVYTALLNPEKE